MRDYQLRSDQVLLRLAIDHEIKPTGSAIAEAAGLPTGTVNAVRKGRCVRVPTMLALSDLFGCTIDDLFHLVEFDEQPESVPAA